MKKVFILIKECDLCENKFEILGCFTTRSKARYFFKERVRDKLTSGNIKPIKASYDYWFIGADIYKIVQQRLR